MKLKNEDRRIRRSKKIIADAFLTSMEFHDYEENTVTNIENLADYKRTTFIDILKTKKIY